MVNVKTTRAKLSADLLVHVRQEPDCGNDPAYCALLGFSLVVGWAGSGAGSSNDGGGGVVSITHPIHMQITSTARTARMTGRAMAHQASHAGNPK